MSILRAACSPQQGCRLRRVTRPAVHRPTARRERTSCCTCWEYNALRKLASYRRARITPIDAPGQHAEAPPQSALRRTSLLASPRPFPPFAPRDVGQPRQSGSTCHVFHRRSRQYATVTVYSPLDILCLHNDLLCVAADSLNTAENVELHEHRNYLHTNRRDERLALSFIQKEVCTKLMRKGSSWGRRPPT